MGNERLRGAVLGAKSAKDGEYDSDKDLDQEMQNNINKAGRDSSEAQKLRDSAWENKGKFPNLMKSLKGAWAEDKWAKKK